MWRWSFLTYQELLIAFHIWASWGLSQELVFLPIFIDGFPAISLADLNVSFWMAALLLLSPSTLESLKGPFWAPYCFPFILTH